MSLGGWIILRSTLKEPPVKPVSPVSVVRRWLDSDQLVLIACLCAIPAGVLLAGG